MSSPDTVTKLLSLDTEPTVGEYLHVIVLKATAYALIIYSIATAVKINGILMPPTFAPRLIVVILFNTVMAIRILKVASPESHHQIGRMDFILAGVLPFVTLIVFIDYARYLIFSEGLPFSFFTLINSIPFLLTYFIPYYVYRKVTNNQDLRSINVSKFMFVLYGLYILSLVLSMIFTFLFLPTGTGDLIFSITLFHPLTIAKIFLVIIFYINSRNPLAHNFVDLSSATRKLGAVVLFIFGVIGMLMTLVFYLLFFVFSSEVLTVFGDGYSFSPEQIYINIYQASTAIYAGIFESVLLLMGVLNIRRIR